MANGKRQMSGTIAERLFNLLPPRMPLAKKYQLVENLWRHIGPKSKKTLRVGLDAGNEQVLDAVRKHIDDVVVYYKIPENLEKRFNWLAAGDAHVKQDLLNHLQQYEKRWWSRERASSSRSCSRICKGKQGSTLIVWRRC